MNMTPEDMGRTRTERPVPDYDDSSMVLVLAAACGTSGFLLGVLAHILWGFL